ncbi:DNA-3-methyladenine glycosylase [Patescibacteria group bacterium]|nr:DNA-3-methyladenine glycosylase [Patescibacteria group bacterium]
MRKVLQAAFFDRPTLTVARELVGKFLVRRVRGSEVALMIVETEAYDGPRDKASHAHRGQTARNTPMFGRPGVVYVYFTYGMHWMLNLVCGKERYPAAVLIRGLEPQWQSRILSHGELPPTGRKKRVGLGLAARSALFFRPVGVRLDGPAKLTKFLQVDKKLNNKPLGKKTGLWVEDRGVEVGRGQVRCTPRIGIDSAGEYVNKPWRFVLDKKG